MSNAQFQTLITAVTRFGFYNPWMLIGTAFQSISLGLFSTFHTYTDHSKWIGYQVIFGAGAGSAMPMVNHRILFSKIGRANSINFRR